MRDPTTTIGKHTRGRGEIKAAIAEAREFLDVWESRLLPQRGTPFFFADEMRRLDTKVLRDKIQQGGDDADMAYAILQARIADALRPKQGHDAVVLPNPLAVMIINFLYTDRPQPKRGRGRNWRAHWDRDALIVAAVKLAHARQFPVTRNPASRSASACAIVASALGELGLRMSEDAVAKIWARRHRIWGRPSPVGNK